MPTTTVDQTDILRELEPVVGSVFDRHLNAVLGGLAATIVLGFVAFRYLF